MKTYPLPSTSISHAPRMKKNGQPQERPLIHDEQPFESNSFMSRSYGNFQAQPSMKPWVPNYDNQKERPRSVSSAQNIHLASNNQWNYGHSEAKQTGKVDQCLNSQAFKFLFPMVMIAMVLGALGISIYVLVGSKITTTTTTTTTNTTTTTTTTTTSASLPTQCNSYAFINDPTRLATAAGGSANDQSVFGGTYVWYRFYGSGGGTQIVTSAPAYNRCGGTYSGWFASTMPTIGNTMAGTVCFVLTTNICYYSNTILVTNCDSYYVYGLIDPPVAFGRYCTV